MKGNNLFQDKEYLAKNQYKSDKNLNARIKLHEEYSVNPEGWIDWLAEEIKLNTTDVVLDVGCGPGSLWVTKIENGKEFPNLILSDISIGMVKVSKRNVGDRYQYSNLDATHLPLKSSSIDVVVANHMLYHVPDLAQTLSEFNRVLKPGGKLFASTNGETHLIEIKEIMSNFIDQSRFNRSLAGFSAENGEGKLFQFFSSIMKSSHPNKLIVPVSIPIVDYMTSMVTEEEAANLSKSRMGKFIDEIISKNGPIEITKDSVLFKAIKK